MRLIDADEAVGTLLRMAKDCVGCGELQEGEEYAIAAHVLRRKVLTDVPSGRDINKHIQQLEAQVPKWISVEERLPEDDVDVLVYAVGNHENSCVAMTSYTHHMHGYNIEGWRSPWQYFSYEHKITHWMPLTEPPKEDDHA